MSYLQLDITNMLTLHAAVYAHESEAVFSYCKPCSRPERSPVAQSLTVFVTAELITNETARRPLCARRYERPVSASITSSAQAASFKDDIMNGEAAGGMDDGRCVDGTQGRGDDAGLHSACSWPTSCFGPRPGAAMDPG